MDITQEVSGLKTIVQNLANEVFSLKSIVQDLALAMQNGFQSLEQRTERIEHRMDAFEHRMGALEHGVGEVKTEVHELNRRVGNLEVGMEDVKELLGDTAQAVDLNSVTIIGHGERISALELRIA